MNDDGELRGASYMGDLYIRKYRALLVFVLDVHERTTAMPANGPIRFSDKRLLGELRHKPYCKTIARKFTYHWWHCGVAGRAFLKTGSRDIRYDIL